MSANQTDASAAHWCQVVMEEVVPVGTKSAIIPPPTPPLHNQTLNASMIGSSKTDGTVTSSIPPNPYAANNLAQYQQYYAQYYNAAVYGGGYPQYSLTTPGYPYPYQPQVPSPTMGTLSYNQQMVAPSFATNPTITTTTTLASNSNAITKKPTVSRFQKSTDAIDLTDSTSISSTSPRQSQAKDQWPPNLTKYVETCFKPCVTDKDREHVMKILQTKITQVSNEGRLYKHKWELEPPINPPPTTNNKPISISNTIEKSTFNSVNNSMKYSYDYDMYSSSTSPTAAASTITTKKRKSRWVEDSEDDMTDFTQALTNPQLIKQKASKLTLLSTPSSFSASSSSSSNSYKDLKSTLTMGIYGPSSSSNSISQSTSIKETAPSPKGTKNEIKKSKGGILEHGERLLYTESEVSLREKRANRFAVTTSSSDIHTGNIDNTQSQLYTFHIGSSDHDTNITKGKGKKKEKLSKKQQKLLLQQHQSAASSSSKYSSNNSISYELNTIGEEFNIENLKIIGTCQKVEKDYLRLTSAPAPSTVRPQPILQIALKNLITKWKENNIEYVSLCSQMKAIRQDLTVQHIQNDFTVEVYETHARMALMYQDLNEYNQCQTQLKHLYAQGYTGSEVEFIAYRILYYVYLSQNKKYQSGGSDLTFIMQSILPRPHLLESEPIKHALKVCQAIRTDNYHIFFQLYKTTPNMGNNLLSLMIDTVRIQYLQRICKSHKPNVPVEFVCQELGFDFTPKILTKSPDKWNSISSHSSSSHKKESKQHHKHGKHKQKDTEINDYEYNEKSDTFSPCIDFLTKLKCILVTISNDTSNMNNSIAYMEVEYDLNTKDTVLDMSAVFTQDKLLL